MTRRVTTKSVIFAQPFVVDAESGELPPGIYIVETEEQLLYTLSSRAYRRLSTVMHYPAIGGTRFVAIDPKVLDEALKRDKRPQ
jgi:hypothetical protein